MIQIVKNIMKPIYYPLRNLFYRVRVWLAGIKVKEFDDSFYDDKRVIVIGPAESSLSYMSGEEIDKFDVIVRVNKSHLTLDENTDKLGSRTDVLYHCCHPDPIGGCDYINEERLTQQSNKIVVYPYYEFSEMFRFYNFLLKFKAPFFMRLNKKYYLDIKKVYPAKIPTTGYQTLNHLLQQGFKELHITGFTFLKTSYISGYRDSHQTPEKIMKLVNRDKNHNPEAEFKLFCETLLNLKSKNIYLDQTLKNILDEQ